jgi:glycosyltransferase involved in cell wall biosynthesis
VRDLAQAQARDGHEVGVLTVETGLDHERGGAVEWDGDVVVHRMGIRLPLRAPFNPAAARRSVEVIRKARPDVIHVHGGTLSPFALGVAKIGVAEGIPVAATFHTMLDHAYPVLRPWARSIGWAGAPIAWSAVSTVAARHVGRVYGVEVNVLHNGIDTSAWGPTTPGPDRTPLRCVATMRLVPSKRSSALVDVVADAQEDLAPGALTLDVFGDGPDRWRLVRQLRRRRLDGVVTLHGRVARAALRESYARSHVFLSSATREAFGIAALEARTAGLVVAARSGTGLDDFISHERDGVLAASDDQLARELSRLAMDRDRLESLRANATAFKPPFDIQEVVASAAYEYERAAELRRAGSLSNR